MDPDLSRREKFLLHGVCGNTMDRCGVAGDSLLLLLNGCRVSCLDMASITVEGTFTGRKQEKWIRSFLCLLKTNTVLGDTKKIPTSIFLTLELNNFILTMHKRMALNETVIWMDDAVSVTLKWKLMQRGAWDWKDSEKTDCDIHLLHNGIVFWKKMLLCFWYPDSACCSQNVQFYITDKHEFWEHGGKNPCLDTPWDTTGLNIYCSNSSLIFLKGSH